ncbi:MAG: hypothetical protein JO322_10710 [Candidatus Eremiobacteraeota bacterium]|nr:hypothetical protein [Candidatus Eremiobacteraeota bacterium]
MIAAVFALVLVMPSGWERVAVDNAPGSTVEMLDIGRGPTIQGFAQQINVLRHRLADPAISISAWADQSVSYLQSHGDARVLSSHPERLCNGTQDGWWIESNGTYSGRKLDLVQVALLDGGYEYVATYSRPDGTDFDVAAVKALDSLCPAREGEDRAP